MNLRALNADSENASLKNCFCIPLFLIFSTRSPNAPEKNYKSILNSIILDYIN